MNDILNEELDSAFVAPSRQFKGEELAPYTEGSRLLLMQVRDDDDSSAFFVWAFVYLHILLKRNRKEAIELCWKRGAFRESLFDWVSKQSEDDRAIATEICSAMVEEASKARVEVIPTPNQLPEGKA